MLLRLPVQDESDCPYAVDGAYALALPGLVGRQRVRVQDVSRQKLAKVTFVEAKRELGHYRSQSDWRAKWVRRFDKSWCRRHPTASDADLVRRFSQHWSARDCWVIEFVMVEGPPRLLASQRAVMSGQTGDGEYVGVRFKSIDPDVEVVDEATLTRFVAASVERRTAERESALQARAERRRGRLRRFGGQV